MDLQLKGKKALVLSASKGIGKGVAVALAQEGVHVLITSSNAENLKAAKEEIVSQTKASVDTFLMDMTQRESVKKAIAEIMAKHRGVDILVTNGPGPKVIDAAVMSDQDLEGALYTNFQAMVQVCNAFLPFMMEQKFGRIVHLTSITAKEPDVGMILSNVARAAVLAYGKTLSREVAKHGITVNSILTGGVKTERTVQLRKMNAERQGVPYEELEKRANGNFPVGFVATPEQFSPIIAFLASPVSSYINGVSLPVDGGFMRSH